MRKDLNKILIEGMLKKAMEDIHSSPGRTVRNLIDLAVNFSKGRFQKRLMQIAQEMLQNTESPYYELLTDIVENVDMDLLMKFGMNLGYNGCTRGAQRIRQIEAEKGFNVPWCLMLNINQEKLDEDPEIYSGIVKQGVELGIHTYLLAVRNGDLEMLIPLFEEQSDCAFGVFVNGCQLTDRFLEGVRENKNVMISVYNDEHVSEVCQRLREHRLLYGVQQRYTEKDRDRILSGDWISGVLPYHPQFAFLISETVCKEELRREIYQYIVETRTEQKYPVYFIDVVSDMWMIDQIISEDAWVVGFECDGNIRTYNGLREEKEYNIFENSLEDILYAAVKK